jgi:spore coat protein JB
VLTVKVSRVSIGDEEMTKQSEAKSVQLLEQLQAIDYALVELKLYLNAIPEDSHALRKCISLNEQREVIRIQLHLQIGAISSYDIMSDPDNRKWSLAP